MKKENLKSIEQQFIEFKEFADMQLSKLKYLDIKGNALGRRIWIFDRELPIDFSRTGLNGTAFASQVSHSEEFNWGYGGSGPAQLAYAILQLVSTPYIALHHHQLFKACVVAFLPNSDFHVRIDMEKFADSVHFEKNGSLPHKKTHAYELMAVNVNHKYNEKEVWVSKFLDIPNLPLKQAKFESNSVEYTELLELRKPCENGGFSGFKYLQKYCERMTKRKAINTFKSVDGNLVAADECTELEFDMIDDCFRVHNGMGTGLYRGYKIGSYERL